MTMKKTIYIVAESSWNGVYFTPDDVSVFFDKDEAERYCERYCSLDKDNSCDLFEKEIDIEIDLKQANK